MSIVVLDPGHGGNQRIGGSSPNNATGPNGLLEKDLTLDVSIRVRDALAAFDNVATVILTRNDDTNLGLTARAHVARDNNAAIFLSIHFNGFNQPNVDGTEVWIANNPTGQSQQFAQTLLNQVVAVTNVRNRGVRQQDFGVLVPSRHNANTSAALLEVAFLTNPAQANRLTQPNYRDQLAQAIATAIHQSLPVPQPVAQGNGYGSYGQSYGGGYAQDYGPYGGSLRELEADFSNARSLGDFIRILSESFRRRLRFRQGIDDPTFFPHSSICHFLIHGDDGNTYQGTGFYIAPNRILTAGHNVHIVLPDPTREVRATAIDITPGRAHNMSTYPSFTVRPSDWVKHPQWDPHNSRADFDLAVIKVNQRPPHDVFPIEELRMSPQSGIAVCGYALGPNINQLQQNIDVDTIHDLEPESFTYGLHTRGGTSGSPVFYTDGGQVIAVGVHSREATAHVNRGCRLTDAKVRWIRSI